jgi:hypothetical protein
MRESAIVSSCADADASELTQYKIGNCDADGDDALNSKN